MIKKTQSFYYLVPVQWRHGWKNGRQIRVQTLKCHYLANTEPLAWEVLLSIVVQIIHNRVQTILHIMNKQPVNLQSQRLVITVYGNLQITENSLELNTVAFFPLFFLFLLTPPPSFLLLFLKCCTTSQVLSSHELENISSKFQ